MAWRMGKAAVLNYTPADMLIDIEGTLADAARAADADTTICDYAQAIIDMLNKHYVR